MQRFRRTPVVSVLTTLAAAILLSASAAADEVAAKRVGAAGHGHARAHGGFGAPLFNQAPLLPPPIFNPSTPYTAPVSPEVPVSPASPGSVFGNGPDTP